MTFPAHQQRPEFTEPGKRQFDLPAPTIAAQLPVILGRRFLAVAPVRHEQVDVPLSHWTSATAAKAARSARILHQLDGGFGDGGL